MAGSSGSIHPSASNATPAVGDCNTQAGGGGRWPESGPTPPSGYARRYVSHDRIEIRGAREHNLKNVDLSLPRDKLIVITGLSGSGKSSLAFDTIYAEGQRRYVESLSAYARQFLGQ